MDSNKTIKKIINEKIRYNGFVELYVNVWRVK